MRRLLGVLVTTASVVAAAPVGAGSMLYATAASQARVDGFCVRGDGSLDSTPKVTVPTDIEPRRLLVVGDLLYVATKNRLQAFRIAAKGGLTKAENGSTLPIESMEPFTIATSPDGGLLYVTQHGLNRIAAYPIGPNGFLTPDQDYTSCIQGQPNSGFQTVLVANGMLYVGAAGATRGVQVFLLRPNGGLPAIPIECAAGSICTGGEHVGASCVSNAACGGSTCERPDATPPLSCRNRFGRPRSILVSDTNTLYVADKASAQVFAFPLQPDGTFDPSPATSEIMTCFNEPATDTEKKKNAQAKKYQQQPASKIEARGRYERLIRFGSTLLATEFDFGRVDSYLLTDGNLPKRPTRVSADVRTSPVGETVSADGVLYVAGGELDRVRAYRLQASDGALPAGPFSETAEQKASFPNDVALAVLSAGCE